MGRQSYWLSVLLAILARVVSTRANESRSIQIQNKSGRDCGLYWIDVGDDNEAHSMKAEPLQDKEAMQLNSFVGHVFECREAPDFETGFCENDHQACSIARIVVPEEPEAGSFVFIDQDFVVTYSPFEEPVEPPKVQDFILINSPPQTVELPFKPVPLVRCLDILHESAGVDLSVGVEMNMAQIILSDMVQCMQSNVTHELLETKEVLLSAKLARGKQVDFFENYTCADNDMPTTAAIRQESWYNPKEDRTFEVAILHERPASRVHALENFITPEECKAMEDAAQPLLHKASVADGKGGSTYSPNRKAMQAGIKVPWEKEAEGDLIATLSRRVYDYTNHVLGLDLKENGQEDLMSIQYFGRGKNDTEPDRYMPHCDGDCDGRAHMFGNRMATMVLYCTIPEIGGATNFRNAGIHIKPKVGSGTFFSYIDPETMRMDLGFTEHSGCPVIQGEKKIVTQWIRLGVDDENPWDSFNTLGLKKTDEDEQG